MCIFHENLCFHCNIYFLDQQHKKLFSMCDFPKSPELVLCVYGMMVCTYIYVYTYISLKLRRNKKNFSECA